jgi:UDP-2,3-diacylglucosamine pyrophosphatase LpxH
LVTSDIRLLLKLNGPVNYLRQKLGLGFWSLSAAVKRSVKEAVNFIGAFEEGVVRMARADGVDGVVCGHIHTPIIREIDGVPYYNTGDWVESTSALLENFDGRIELLTHFEADDEIQGGEAMPLAIEGAVAA